MKTQEKREQFRRGQDVYLRVQIAPNVPTKRRPAEVLEVLRAACRLKVEGEETPRLVPFRDIELRDDVPPVKAVPPPEPEPVRQPERRVVHDLPVQKPKTPPATTQIAQLRQERTDVDAWLAMGRDLLVPMQERVALLRQEDAALSEEAALIGERRRGIAAELEVVNRRIEKVKDAIES